MSKLKLTSFADDKPVKVTVELPANVHRDLVAYAEGARPRKPGTQYLLPSKLVAPMLERFMSTDRAFTKARHSVQIQTVGRG